MSDSGLALFDTAIGPCGIAWGEHGVLSLQLPEVDAAHTRRRLAHRFPDLHDAAPPAPIAQAIADIQRLLQGERADLRTIALDMAGVPSFDQRVYDATRQILPGQTLSYGELAARLGEPGAARSVGQALGRNPFAIIVPCHRVLAAGGGYGGFSAPGGVTTKLRLLAIEGARRGDGPDLFADRDP